MKSKASRTTGLTPMPLKQKKMNESKITPHDLRIGNWVRLAFQGLEDDSKNNFEPPMRPCEVTRIGKIMSDVKFAGRDNDFSVSYEEIEPIPLTDELMRKLGFSKQKKYGCFVSTDYSNVEVVIAKEPLYTNACVVVNDYRTQPCIHCRFLHELQNCYFAISGEELEVRL